MKKIIILLGIIIGIIYAQKPFLDISPDHWAYNAIVDLYNKGIIKGYYNEPVFKGKKPLSRYDMAVLLYRTIEYLSNSKKKNMLSKEDLKKLEKLMIEFSDELSKLGLDSASFKKELVNLERRVSVLEKEQRKLRKVIIREAEERENFWKKLRPIDVLLIIATGVLIGKVYWAASASSPVAVASLATLVEATLHISFLFESKNFAFFNGVRFSTNIQSPIFKWLTSSS